MGLEVTEAQIDRVLEWAKTRRNKGETYRGMTYEDGVINALEWASGDDAIAPDEG